MSSHTSLKYKVCWMSIKILAAKFTDVMGTYRRLNNSAEHWPSVGQSGRLSGQNDGAACITQWTDSPVASKSSSSELNESLKSESSTASLSSPSSTDLEWLTPLRWRWWTSSRRRRQPDSAIIRLCVRQSSSVGLYTSHISHSTVLSVTALHADAGSERCHSRGNRRLPVTASVVPQPVVVRWSSVR